MKKFVIAILVLSISSVVYGTNYCTEQVIQQRVVQFDNNTFLGLNGYYSHGAALLAQKENEEVTDLKEQNKLLRDILKKLTDKDNSTPNKPETTPTVEKSDYTDLETKVLGIFKESCAKCHGDTKADGGLTLVKNGHLMGGTTRKERVNSSNLIGAVLSHHRVNGINLNEEARMPKGSPALSDDKVEIIRLWLVELAKSLKGE